MIVRYFYLKLMSVSYKNMNRELFLSLGITILTSATLFIYFRHRFKIMEHKVNTIFQMVQNHAKAQQMPQPQMPPMANRMMHRMPPMGNLSSQSTAPDTRIEVSDDESRDSDTSDDESDTASEISIHDAGESPDTPKEIEIQNIKVEGNLKQISVTLDSSSEAPINLEEKIDLDEISSLEDNEENEQEEDTEKPQEDAHVVEETPNYAKMTVATLKKIASKKGITGYNKLRKQGLVDILSN